MKEQARLAHAIRLNTMEGMAGRHALQLDKKKIKMKLDDNLLTLLNKIIL